MAEGTSQPRQPSEQSRLSLIFSFKFTKDLLAALSGISNFVNHLTRKVLEKGFNDVAANTSDRARNGDIWVIIRIFLLQWVPRSESVIVLSLDLLSNNRYFTASDNFPSNSHVTNFWTLSSFEKCIRLLRVQPFILKRVQIFILLINLAIAIFFHQSWGSLNCCVKELLIQL